MKNNSKPRKNHVKEEVSFDNQLPKDYPWKVLGWLTEDLCQFLSQEEQDKVGAIVRNRDLDALLALSSSWGLLSMPQQLQPGESWLNLAAKYQLACLLKKFRFDTELQARKDKALEKFIQGESSCASYNREGYTKLSVGSESWMVNVFTYAQSFMRKLLGFALPDLRSLTDRSRHGPGATLGTRNGQVSTYFKYGNWPYECTGGAARMARLTIELDERWLGALEHDYRERFGIPKHAILNRDVFWSKVIKIVDGNRITFAPKDALTERTIAIEPTMNLYLQLGVDGFIRRRLKRWGVDLNSQTKNQMLAFLGSVTQIDPFVTIDLANASNSISLKLCKLLLPDEWYDYLCDLRSPKGILPDGKIIDYEMISSMGNGYTFALESAIFAALIYAVQKETFGKVDVREWTVFGDDLIVRQSIFERLLVSLTNCGFAINTDKTFVSGCVRESCGTDWYQGKPVRPVFLDEVPSDLDMLFSDLNRLKRILEMRFGLTGTKIESGLLRWIPAECRFYGPYSDEKFDAYIHTALPTVPYKNCVYRFTQIFRRPKYERNTNNFFFRKLMSDLRPARPREIWEKQTGSGSRFDVCRRNRYTLSRMHSVASNWQSEYGELSPGKERKKNPA